MQRRTYFRMTGSAALAGALGATTVSLAAAAPAAAQPAASPLPVPITGLPLLGGTFSGVFNLAEFAVQNGALAAVGTLTGTLKDALGNVVGTVTDLPLTLPVTQATGTCDILHLELGPLDLNLLGLMVHLDKVVLDITAEQGSGNLLGNLLCAVAHLLDSNAAPQALANLLNHILGALG